MVVLCLLIFGALQHKNEKSSKNAFLQHKQAEKIILLSPNNINNKAKSGFGSLLHHTLTLTKKSSRLGIIFLHTYIF